jgi:hypothetical protein
MTREQYLVSAVEIGLFNRTNARAFAHCTRRLALLPYCLRDLDANCRAKSHDVGAACTACSGACYVNDVSRLLRRHRVRPYIRTSINLRRQLRNHTAAGDTLGVLGIACIPELRAGMRMCAKLGLPVLGLPLDANCCARWFGEFRQTTVNMHRLERLVSNLE